jgi:glycine cleavage system H protein
VEDEMDFPDDLRYTEQHEWARREGDRIRVGITDYAQDALGDVVYVDTPDVGTEVTGGAPFGEVESTKSVSDVYAPVSGTVVEVNAVLADSPDRVNEDPYGEGWMIVIEPSDPAAFDALWNADRYRTFTEAESGQA